jgi:malate/lactate dehydrogenase
VWGLGHVFVDKVQVGELIARSTKKLNRLIHEVRAVPPQIISRRCGTARSTAPFATLATFTLAQDEFRSAAFASPHRYKQIKDERDENTMAIKSN